MLFTYKPEGAPPEKHKVWKFEPGKLMSPEAEAIERVTGLSFPAWIEALTEDESTTAVHALLWVLLKRETPTLRYEQVEFCYDEWDLAFDDEEKPRLLKELNELEAGAKERGEALPPEAAALLEQLRSELTTVETPEPEAPEESPGTEVPKEPEAEESPTSSVDDELEVSTSPT